MSCGLRSVTLAGALLVSTAFGQEALPQPGKPAAMFRLMAYNPKAAGGPTLGLDKFIGDGATDKAAKVVLLSFMASFCAPCKKEMPWLQTLHEKYASQGLRIVMVSIDDQPDGMKIIEQLIEANKVTFPVLKDRTTLVARRWLGAQSPLPSVFMIKPDGIVSLSHRGYNEEQAATLEKDIRAQLGLAP